MLDIFIYAGLSWLIISNLVQTYVQSRKEKKGTPPAITTTQVASNNGDHVLAKTWMEPDPTDRAYAGWRWKCKCGVQGVATNCKKGILGSEANAIERFKDHAEGYREANFDAQQAAYDNLAAEYKLYREKCYCKETNNDLIVLKHTHP